MSDNRNGSHMPHPDEPTSDPTPDQVYGFAVALVEFRRDVDGRLDVLSADITSLRSYQEARAKGDQERHGRILEAIAEIKRDANEERQASIKAFLGMEAAVNRLAQNDSLTEERVDHALADAKAAEERTAALAWLVRLRKHPTVAVVSVAALAAFGGLVVLFANAFAKALIGH